jgi:hypothetical protein
MNPDGPPRFRITVSQLQGGKTTQVIDVYGSGFITAVATLNDDIMDVHFGSGGPRDLIEHIAEAITDEHNTQRRR